MMKPSTAKTLLRLIRYLGNSLRELKETLVEVYWCSGAIKLMLASLAGLFISLFVHAGLDGGGQPPVTDCPPLHLYIELGVILWWLWLPLLYILITFLVSTVLDLFTYYRDITVTKLEEVAARPELDKVSEASSLSGNLSLTSTQQKIEE